MNFFRNLFIENSTLGYLKGNGDSENDLPFTKDDKKFNELSFIYKLYAFLITSFIRYTIDLITILVPASLIGSIVHTVQFYYSDNREVIQEVVFNEFSINLTTWLFFILEFIFCILLLSIIYFIIRGVVNIVSVIYYSFKN